MVERHGEIVRQWRILLALESKSRGLTLAEATELAGEGVSDRTIRRDFDALTQAGFPIETLKRDGKTYFVMTDAEAFREGVGRLLAEVQRIKGDGDYDAARALFEQYGVHFDPALRDEIVARVDALDLPSYTAFVMPRLEARYDAAGQIVDVEISYPCDLEAQMLEYSAFAREAIGQQQRSKTA